jgi:hypothetical protein
LTYEYRSLSDHVKPDALAAYLADLESARKTVGYTLRKNAQKPVARPLSRIAAAIAGALFVAIGVLAVAAVFVTRKTQAADAAGKPDRHSHRWLLGTGILVCWFPVLGALAFVCMIGALAGNLKLFGWGTVLCVLLLLSLWQKFWRARWLRWACAHASDTDQFMHKARDWGMADRLSALPTRPIAAITPGEGKADAT